MANISLFALLAVCFIALVNADTYGHAKVVGGAANPNIVGTVYFVQQTGSTLVTVYANIAGITNNSGLEHGMHVHMWGESLDPTIASAGMHFRGNGNGNHGCPPNPLRDYGDMGNWTVNADGTLSQNKTLDLLTLDDENSIIGRSVLLHLGSDNCVNETSAGVRLARGVIGIGNPAYLPTTVTVNAATNPGTKQTNNKAVCYLLPTNGQTATGTVTFETVPGGTQVTGLFSGIPLNSKHGLHVHQYGDLSTNDGQSIGGHYNPFNQSHGLPPGPNIHIGDLGSVCAYDSNGNAFYSYLSTLVSLTGPQSVLGRSVSLHASADNGSEISYGARIAQCVIGIANNSTVAPTSTVPSSPVTCGLSPNTTSTSTLTSSTGSSGSSTSGSSTGTSTTNRGTSSTSDASRFALFGFSAVLLAVVAALF